MLTSLLYILLLFTSTTHGTAPPSLIPSPPAFLKGIVDEIAGKEKWDLVRVSEFDAGSVLVGESQRYEFHIRVGRTVLIVRFSEVESWRKVGSGERVDLIGREGEGRTTVGDIELEGPVDVHVGGGDDELELRLPAMNKRQRGLRRVLVGAGIKVKVEGAKEVSLSHPYGARVALNGSLGTGNVGRRKSSALLGQSFCSPLLSVRISGSASVVAHNTHSSKAFIQTAFRSQNTVELLPDKCYINEYYRPTRSYLLASLHSRLALVEDRLQSFIGYRVFQNSTTRFLKAKITSPTLVKFRMELERNTTENDRTWKKVAEWKTKPVTERQSFDIVASAGGSTGLESLVVKKVKRAFTVSDSTAWSNLMSNISFTQFPSIVVPPEPLTLDVKW